MHSIVLLMWLALCSQQDVRERRLSTSMTTGVAACALVWLLFTGHSWIGADASDAGWGLAIVMLLTLPGCLLGRFDADDVKLMGALALATSYQHVLGTFIGAGVAVVLWVLCRRRLWAMASAKVRKRIHQVVEECGDRQPFAPYVLIGFLLATLWIQ